MLEELFKSPTILSRHRNAPLLRSVPVILRVAQEKGAHMEPYYALPASFSRLFSYSIFLPHRK